MLTIYYSYALDSRSPFMGSSCYQVQKGLTAIYPTHEWTSDFKFNTFAI